MLEAGDDLGERCDDLGLAERRARRVHPLLEKYQTRIELPRGRAVMANRAQGLQADLARDLPGRHELLIRFLAAGIERRDQHGVSAARDLALDRAARRLRVL